MIVIINLIKAIVQWLDIGNEVWVQSVCVNTCLEQERSHSMHGHPYMCMKLVERTLICQVIHHFIHAMFQPNWIFVKLIANPDGLK